MNNDFEQTYVAVRTKENRIYTDSEVLQLPDIFSSHDYAAEWKVRKRSAKKLAKYLTEKNKALRILEIGCGNGWLSFQLSNIKHSHVIGLDVNKEEVMQAKRVFKKDNLSFIHGEFTRELFEVQKFDCILFAASIQYFPSLEKILPQCLSLLADGGELHMIDTHFYNERERKHAADRSFDYYRSLGFPDMAENYHHHTYDELKTFRYKILSHPENIINSWIRRQKHFPWIIIKA